MRPSLWSESALLLKARARSMVSKNLLKSASPREGINEASASPFSFITWRNCVSERSIIVFGICESLPAKHHPVKAAFPRKTCEKAGIDTNVRDIIPFQKKRTATGTMLKEISALKFNDKGLVPAIAQDIRTGEVLMMAWMNAEALEKTVQTGKAHYFSRSRDSLWLKRDFRQLPGGS